MVAFSGFYESHEPPPSGDVRGILSPHCNHHRNGHQSGYILHYSCVDCRPGGRRGLVASCEALVILHRAMHSVLHRRTAMAIEMARDGGTFVLRCRLF